MLKDRLGLLDDLIEEAYTVYNSEVSWERKYRLIFSEAVSGQIIKALTGLNLVLVWCDPDTSYQEDVAAYIEALEKNPNADPYYKDRLGLLYAANATEENGFKLTANQLRNAVSDKTKALILCNPCNPTGTVYSGDEIKEMVTKIIGERYYLKVILVLFHGVLINLNLTVQMKRQQCGTQGLQIILSKLYR